MKKKDALQELAVALVLVLEFSKDVDTENEDAVLLMNHTRERAFNALEMAEQYTGVAGMEDVKVILQSQIDNYTTDCTDDIVRGDTIRFTEAVYDNRKKPPRYLGRRTVSADVMDVKLASGKPILLLEIIGTQGTWPIKAGTETKRFVKNVAHFGVKRLPWEDEAKRAKVKKGDHAKADTIVATFKKESARMFGRYDRLRADED